MSIKNKFSSARLLVIATLASLAGLGLRLCKLNEIQFISPAESFWLLDKDLGQYLDKGFGPLWYGVIRLINQLGGLAGIYQLRLLSAFVGVLIVVTITILATKLFSVRVGIYSGVIANFAIVLVISSRLATMIEVFGLSLLLGAWAIMVVVRGLGTSKLAWLQYLCLISLSVGLSLFGVLPLLILIGILGYQLIGARLYRDRLRLISIGVAIFSVLLLIDLGFSLASLNWAKIEAKTVFDQSNPILSWLTNFIEVFQHLFITGLDRTGYFFWQLSIVELNLAVLAIVGLVSLYFNQRSIFKVYGATLVLFWAIASLFKAESSFGWLLIILIGLIPLAGYGLGMILAIIDNNFKSKLIRGLSYGLIVSIFVAWFGLGYQQVFVAWPESQATYQIYREDLNMIAESWANEKSSSVIVTGDGLDLDLLETISGFDHIRESSYQSENDILNQELKDKQIYLVYLDGANDQLVDQIKYKYQDQIEVDLISSDLTDTRLYYILRIK
ncbi:hypothetical protein KC853_01625 [Candidatus Saccharibacteria bacterium]|nr:hypothetical protein [Candidatus Saccharibacteria bacterium]MCB9834802.1 hypothetical protein [Candidatus Nomurabacteria bacterium]